MIEPVTEPDLEPEAPKTPKKAAKPKPAAAPSQTERARAIAMAKIKAAKR